MKGEEKHGLCLNRLSPEPENKAIETNQEEEVTPSLVPRRDGTNCGKVASKSCES